MLGDGGAQLPPEFEDAAWLAIERRRPDLDLVAGANQLDGHTPAPALGTNRPLHEVCRSQFATDLRQRLHHGGARPILETPHTTGSTGLDTAPSAILTFTDLTFSSLSVSLASITWSSGNALPGGAGRVWIGKLVAAGLMLVAAELLSAAVAAVFLTGFPIGALYVPLQAAAFYLVLASFSESGMAGLLDQARGRRGPVKLRPQILRFHPGVDGGPGRAGRAGRAPVRGTAAPAHHRAGSAAMSARSFWPPVEAAQIDYETRRAHVLEHDRLPGDLAGDLATVGAFVSIKAK